MAFFLRRAIDVVKLLLLITIGSTAKLTYDLTTTSYDSEAENKYTHEQKIDEKFLTNKALHGTILRLLRNQIFPTIKSLKPETKAILINDIYSLSHSLQHRQALYITRSLTFDLLQLHFHQLKSLF